MQNIAENLKVGGYFIGCCFDGETVYNSLSKLALGGVLTGKEGDAVPADLIAKVLASHTNP